MNNDIKVSIVCNVYNHGKYLRDALEGFVSQKTNFPFEVLIHDDASPDNSPEIIREYEQRYPDIIKPIYQTENQYSKKVAITRIFQAPRVKGKYVATCEGDDYWTDPLKLQKQYDFMEANPEYSMCACSTDWMNLRTGILENRCRAPKDMDISLEEIILGTKGTYFQYASFFVRSEIFVSNPDWRRKFPIGDYPLMIMAALNGKVRMLADVMTVYRYYADNSWTVRMDNDEGRAMVSQKMITGLTALDEQTGYQHTDIIRRRILRHQYTYALMTHDYKALRSGELGEMFRARSLPYRISDMMRCKYPKLYSATMKPLTKILKSKYGE